MKEQTKKILTSRPFWAGLIATGSALAGTLGYSSLSLEEQERLATVLSSVLYLFGN